MGLNGVWELLDTNRRYDLIISCNLQKFLRQQVVLVRCNELRDVLYDLQNVELILFDGLAGQIRVVQPQAKNVASKNLHLLIGLHVVHVDDIEVVEAVVEGVADLELQVDDRVEYSDLFELD